MKFTLLLGNLSLKEKMEIHDSILENGGEIESLLNEKTNCVICSDGEMEKRGRTMRDAEGMNIPVVPVQYIKNAIENQTPLDRLTLIMDNHLKNTSEQMVDHLKKMETMLLDTLMNVTNQITHIAVSNFTGEQIEHVNNEDSNYLPHLVHRFFQNITSTHQNGVMSRLSIVEEGLSLDKLKELKRYEINKKLEEDAFLFGEFFLPHLE